MLDVPLPQWLDYRSDEVTAAAMTRSLYGHAASWGELIAAAQTTMSYYQDLEPGEDSLTSLYETANALPLIAAARVLDSASRAEEALPLNDRRALALAAMVAYGMHGNFPSAEAVVTSHLPSILADDPSFAPVIATSAPRLLPRVLQLSSVYVHQLRYLERLNWFLLTGDDEVREPLRDLLIQCILADPPAFQSSLLRSCLQTLYHVVTLSVARTLVTHSPNLPRPYTQRLIESGIKVFLPPQYKALTINRIADRSDNSVIALPTGTGKTLLAELALMSSLAGDPGLACYIVPYIALGHQIADSLRAHIPTSIAIRRMFGSFRDVEQTDPGSRQEIVVATPERFDGLMRTSPWLLRSVRCMVFDEAHMVVDASRGSHLEGIITRLRLLQDRGVSHRILLLSAVAGHHANLQRWLSVPSDAVVRDTWESTARRIALWNEDGRLTWFVGESPLLRPGVQAKAVLGYVQMPWPEPSFYEVAHFGDVRKQEPKVYNNVAFLADYLWGRYSCPILLWCSSKASSRGVAKAAAERFQPLEPIPGSIEAMIGRIEVEYPYLRPLSWCLRRGVAYHNSALPDVIRQLIERAAKERLLRVVAATTTLAEGVDLPFRFTIMVDWLAWQDAGYGPVSPLLFRNIAGRCGRPGEFTEGDTILFDNPVGEIEYTQRTSRRQLQDAIMFGATPIGLDSALAASLGGQSRAQVEAALASQVMASIPENPDLDDLSEAFAARTLAAQQSDELRSRTVERVRSVISSLVQGEEDQFAQVASPVRLTELGLAASATGLSPGTARDVIRFLRSPRDHAEMADTGAELLIRFAQVPEQSDRHLQAVARGGRRNRFRVKEADLPGVLRSWVHGDDLDAMFVRLPSVVGSKKRQGVPASLWVTGEHADPDWDREYEQFVDFISASVRYFLPWIVRACGILSTPLGGWGTNRPWRAWAEKFELGVDSSWAVAAAQRGAPSIRSVLAEVGRRWPEEFQSDVDPLGLAYLEWSDGLSEVRSMMDSLRVQLGARAEKSMESLFHWLISQPRPRPGREIIEL